MKMCLTYLHSMYIRKGDTSDVLFLLHLQQIVPVKYRNTCNGVYY